MDWIPIAFVIAFNFGWGVYFGYHLGHRNRRPTLEGCFERARHHDITSRKFAGLGGTYEAVIRDENGDIWSITIERAEA